MTAVSIPLPLARRLLNDLLWLNARMGTSDFPQVEEDRFERREDIAVRRKSLERAIARANRALVPGRWTWDPEDGTVRWFSPDNEAAWCSSFGWMAWTPNDSDGEYDLLGKGPETGAEGRRLADRALAKWAKRQGWRP